MRLGSIVVRSVASGSVAAATSTLALALLARSEGRGASQPLNATSHWAYGDEAARLRDPDIDHTLVGYATHHTATIFWAVFFEGWQAARPTRDPATLLGRAISVAAFAALIDYTITPKRFTPGWELVLTKRSMVLVYAAMAAGFVGTAIAR